MERLINADKFTEVIENKMFDSPLMHPVMEMMDLLELIEEQPTVDAVEVVRCEKCDSFDQFKEDNRGYCERHREVVYCTHYCGYGKPKENN